MPNSKRKQIHEQPKLCDHILSRVTDSSVPLRIAASSIPNAGTGLLVVNNVAAGTDIFRSEPLLVVNESSNNGICDYCLLNKDSPVSPDGRFYTSNAEKEKISMSACMGCKTAEYCSKECQTKAWKSYHKYECGVIKEVKETHRNMGAMPQALCRLLLLIKKKALSEDDLSVIVNLETHFMERNDLWLDKHGDNDDAPLEETLIVAHNVTQAARSNIDLNLARQLYCMLLTNAAAICPAEMIAQYGSFFDLVVSLINHSCDANAHIFFEGRELRCRALRDIPAGAEVTVHYYPTPQYDVLLRRNTLKEYMFISCSCNTCKDEMSEHVAAAVGRRDHLARLRKAQLDLQKLGDEAAKAFGSCRLVQSCISFQDQIGNIIEQGYPNGSWPHHIEPLPTTYRALGAMYCDLRYVVGLEFILKGNLYLRDRSGPSWSVNLVDMVRLMFFLAQAADDDIKWTAATKNMELVQRANMRDVARGYLSLLCVDSKLTFGLDSAFARAVHDWANHAIDVAGDPEIHTEQFREQFRVSQERMLKWAKVKSDRALSLPSRERIVELRRDIATVGTGKFPQIDWAQRAKAVVGCAKLGDVEEERVSKVAVTEIDDAIRAVEAINFSGAEEMLTEEKQAQKAADHTDGQGPRS